MQLALVWDAVNKEHSEKLTGDMWKIHRLISDGQAWTVEAIATTLGLPQTSTSANLRNLRKVGYTVRRVSLSKGLSAYQLILNNFDK